jgi:hypothetical protein
MLFSVRLVTAAALLTLVYAAQRVTPKFLYTYGYEGGRGNTQAHAFAVDALTGSLTLVPGSPYVLADFDPTLVVIAKASSDVASNLRKG